MLELTADRLVLVDGGTAREFDGSIDEYTAFVLSKDAGGKSGAKGGKKDKKAAAEAREKAQVIRKEASDAEAEVAKLTAEKTAIDRAMFDPSTAEARFARLKMGDLMKLGAEIAVSLETAEARWLEASEALEAIAA